jgi:hypothetical protein
MHEPYNVEQNGYHKTKITAQWKNPYLHTKLIHKQLPFYFYVYFEGSSPAEEP